MALTESQRNFARNAYEWATLAGVNGIQADLAVVQAILETAWGQDQSGVSNLHGIKEYDESDHFNALNREPSRFIRRTRYFGTIQHNTAQRPPC